MQTIYDEKDLVSFGNYLLSEERARLFKEEGLDRKETTSRVWSSDLENWQLTQ